MNRHQSNEVLDRIEIQECEQSIVIRYHQASNHEDRCIFFYLLGQVTVEK